MNTNKENMTQSNYPLSEEEFERLGNLPPAEYNKLPRELRNKFQTMMGIKRQKKGLLDWE